jgi:hypothetical protein
MRQISLRTAAALVLILPALAITADAQQRKDQGGGAPAPHVAPAAPAPHIAAPAPHIAAPMAQPHIAAPAPHIAAPAHVAAPMHTAAPTRVAAPMHTAAPTQVAAPAHVATPHVATPRIAHTNTAHPNSVTATAKQQTHNGAVRSVQDSAHHGAPTPANVANSKVAAPSKTNPATTPVIGSNKTEPNKNEPNTASSKVTTPNKPNTTTPNTTTPNVVGQGAGNHGRNAANQQAQTKAQEQAQARAQIYAAGRKPVLKNPAFANAATRDPATRELARATFQGRFAQFHDRDRRDRFEDRRGFRGLVIGWAGPVFWPYAYEDVVDYAFYPYANDTFWPYAYDDVYDSMFGAYAPYASAYANAYPNTSGRRTGRRSDRGQIIASAPAGAPGVGAAEICSADASGLTDWPIERIAAQVQPTDEQRMLLDQLKDATAKAVNLLQSSCPTDLPSTPTGRLAAMRQRIASMLQAVQIVRPALDKFYQSLSDEQKERFIALEAQGTPKAARAGNRQHVNLAQACGGSGKQITGLPISRIAQVLHPDAAQQAVLDELNNATAQAAALLKENCAQDAQNQPITPPARLAAMEARLSAMLQALDTVQPALAKFYNSLTDEQKARFDRLGPRQV